VKAVAGLDASTARLPPKGGQGAKRASEAARLALGTGYIGTCPLSLSGETPEPHLLSPNVERRSQFALLLAR
jgi:hypothetical protein